ncbi:hypothetical protein [Cellulomonas biazotea]|uniref:Uncharacterized protein n=1 Tax=Cellulomonas biazotea TaxID=1709 RepID=A0A402DRW6_9CELL|nr:hypothetical protein [Cellulomonas biazotea]GCE76835.1 hypothetical protein CBZ_18910 [Cellulomonas biazotea]
MTDEKDDAPYDLPVPTGVAPGGHPDPVVGTAPTAQPSPHEAEDAGDGDVPDESIPFAYGYPASTTQGATGAAPPPPLRPYQE